MPLFGKSQKSPAEVVRALKEAVNALEKGGERKAEKAQEDVSKNLVLIKNMLYGTSDSEPQADIVLAQLAQELYNSNLLLLLIQNLSKIDFEGKKDVAQVFNNILRRQIGTRSPTVEYICTRSEILFQLMAGLVCLLTQWKLTYVVIVCILGMKHKKSPWIAAQCWGNAPGTRRWRR